MKKLLIGILLCVTSFSYAECFNTKALAICIKGDGPCEWTEWEPCEVPICLTNESINIYSKVTQRYKVLTFKDESTFTEVLWKYFCIDQDGDRCNVRFRQYTENGSKQSQLYIEYNDIVWVYDITQE